MVDVPKVRSQKTATTLLSDMRCGGLHCRVKGSHLATGHLFGPLHHRLGGYRFHNNEEVDMAVRE
jgi:hypothetical protein